MTILDELREQAHALRQHELEQRERMDERDAHHRATILPVLQRIFRYAQEFAEHVNYIKPEIRVAAYAADYPELVDLQQGRYKVTTDEHGGAARLDALTRVSLSLECYAAGEFERLVRGKAEIERETSSLHDHNLRFTVKRIANPADPAAHAIFTIAKRVPVYFLFMAEPDTGGVQLTVRNFESLGVQRYQLRPEQIDDAFLDLLARYILRKQTGFLRYELDEETHRRLRERLLRDKRDRERELTAAEQRELQEFEGKRRKSVMGRLKWVLNSITTRGSSRRHTW